MRLRSWSHAHKLCRPTNDRAGWLAVTWIKRGHLTGESQTFGRSKLSVTHQARSSAQLHQDRRTTPGCPVTTPVKPGLSLHTASSLRPTTAPATSCWGSLWPSGQAQPCIQWYTATCGWPDASPWHRTAEMSTEWTSRIPSGRRSPHCAPHCWSETISRPLSRLQTVRQLWL